MSHSIALLKNFKHLKASLIVLQDLKKDVDKEHELKNRIMLTGNQLLRMRPNDTDVRIRMEKIEDDWLHLIGSLPNSEEALHIAQQELLPSRQALLETLTWLQQLALAIEEQNGKTPSNSMETRVMLEKYKVLIINCSSNLLCNQLFPVKFCCVLNTLSVLINAGLKDSRA